MVMQYAKLSLAIAMLALARRKNKDRPLPVWLYCLYFAFTQVYSRAWSAKATLQSDFFIRVKRNSIFSSCVGAAKGPRLTVASISAHLLLWVIVTMDCMMPKHTRRP